MEKLFFTSWAIFNAFIYASLFSAYIFSYTLLKNKKALFIGLNAIIISYICYVNFRSGHTQRPVLSIRNDYHTTKLFTKQLVQLENLGIGNIAVLLSYNSDSVYKQQSRLYGIALGHLWCQKAVQARIQNNRMVCSIQGDMQWRLLGCLVYSQPKYFEKSIPLTGLK